MRWNPRVFFKGLLVAGLLGSVFGLMAFTSGPAAYYKAWQIKPVATETAEGFGTLVTLIVTAPLHPQGTQVKDDRLPLRAAAVRTFTPSGIEEDADADTHAEELDSLSANTTRTAKQ